MHAQPTLLNRARQPRPRRTAGAWLLMLALLFGQGLGLVHAITHHAPGPNSHADAPASAALRHTHTHTKDCAHGHPQGLQALFTHDAHEPGCRVYDQLLQAGLLLPVPTMQTLPARARAEPGPASTPRLAAPAGPYQARGPPWG